MSVLRGEIPSEEGSAAGLPCKYVLAVRQGITCGESCNTGAFEGCAMFARIEGVEAELTDESGPGLDLEDSARSERAIACAACGAAIIQAQPPHGHPRCP
jgi:hypothetical protein